MGGQVVITLNKQAETGGEAFIQGCRKKKKLQSRPQSVMVPKHFLWILLPPIGVLDNESTTKLCVLCLFSGSLILEL